MQAFVLNHENADELVAAILKLYQDTTTYNKYAEDGFVYVQQHFDRKKLANKFESILTAIT